MTEITSNSPTKTKANFEKMIEKEESVDKVS